MARRNKPNWTVLHTMQIYSSRAWVYREGQGWIFDELTPDELVEFKSYTYGITIPRMRVRLPYSHAIGLLGEVEINNYVNCFVYCTMPQVHPFVLKRLRIHQITDNEPMHYAWYSVDPGSYEAWLWSDEVAFCQELGCKVTIHRGDGWLEWNVPAEWKPPLIKPPRVQSKEHTFIYALTDEFTKEVRYVGKADNPEKRLAQHLKDTQNSAKWAWIQNLSLQGRKPALLLLEKVDVKVEFERERYWIKHYWQQGHNLTNDICRLWYSPDEEF